MNCDDCCACCKWILLKGKPTGDNKLLWRMRGAKFIKEWIVVPNWCEKCDMVNKRCTIYLRRPNMCKEFQEGSEECELCRKAEGLEVKLSEND